MGKAKSLRSRLSNYFADPATLPARTAQMVAQADHVEWIQVGNEVEAILLEYTLIKRHRPRFNIRLDDDKSYPSMAVTVADEWPRAAVVRGRRRPEVRYFGPYAHVGAIRDTLDLLLRTFQVRTCSDRKLDRHTKLGKPCLLFHIERCSGPCIGAVDHERYDAMVADLMAFLAGDTDDVERRLGAEMEQAAEDLDFERAARLRDRLATLRMACERQQVVTERPEDLDVVGIDEDPLEAAVCVFHVRRGRIVGRRAFVVDKVEDLTRPQLVGRVLEELYGDAEPLGTGAAPGGPGARRRQLGLDLGGGRSPVVGDPRAPPHPGCPGRCSCPTCPRRPRSTSSSWPTGGVRRWPCGCPQRGGKRNLLQTVTRNAGEELARHRLRRASDHDSRARALESLREVLGPGPGPAADRVLRHEPPPGHRLRGIDGGARGRAAPEVRVPPLPHSRRAGQRRLRGDGGGPHPAARARCSRLGPRPGARTPPPAAPGPGASPIRPSSSSSTGARASWAWGCGSSSAWG